MNAPLLTLEEAARHAAQVRSEGGRVALANGAFDLLHVGHLRYLQAARALCDFLVVAINTDESVRMSKGPTRPIVPDGERAELVRALRCVDAVVLFGEKDVVRVLEAIRPDVHAKGTDYTPDTVPEREVVRGFGGEVVICGDPKDHSTTALAARLGAK